LLRRRQRVLEFRRLVHHHHPTKITIDHPPPLRHILPRSRQIQPGRRRPSPHLAGIPSPQPTLVLTLGRSAGRVAVAASPGPQHRRRYVWWRTTPAASCCPTACSSTTCLPQVRLTVSTCTSDRTASVLRFPTR